MTTMLLEQSATPNSQEPLQELTKPTQIIPRDALTQSSYFLFFVGTCDPSQEDALFSHKVVQHYRPEDWPYPPEEDCVKEWNETGA